MKKLILALFFLAGCAYNGEHNIVKYGKIDVKDKSITIEAGSKSLLGDLKQELIRNGWDIRVDTGEETIEGSLASIISLKKYSYKTRYTMDIEYFKLDSRMHWNGDIEPIFSYTITIFDNKNGKEVISLNGKNSSKQAVKDIISAIEGDING